MASQNTLVLVVSICSVFLVVWQADKMLDIINITERKNPTTAAAEFTIRLVLLGAIIAGTSWMWFILR